MKAVRMLACAGLECLAYENWPMLEINGGAGIYGANAWLQRVV
jgi:hypothetical protein